ncbi:hypothetical protein IW262DRAFT_1465814 [Armillaria fumosa]|nr:hypothetical protein IW262DRAFT_1465814 [Armillaria fumosa]
MAPSFDATCDFHKAFHELQHCLAYEAESSDTAMHTSAWVRSVYVSWHCLQLAWLSEEEGFMDDKAWWGLEERLWVLLSSVDVDLVGNSHEEYEFLGNEATKSGIHIPSLPDSSVTHEFSVSESKVIASLVLPSVPTGGEQIIRTPLSTGSPAFPDLPNFPVAPSRRPQGESGSEFELPNSLHLSPTDKYGLQPVLSSSELRRRVRALSPEIDVSPSKRACTTKGKKDKKDQGGSKDASTPKKRGRPHKIRDEKPVFKCRGGLGEPIPKNAMEVAESRLQPIGLLVPDKDFGDYVSCNGFYFMRPLGELVGHLMQKSCDACHHSMTVIVFPPKPPALSELVARLKHLQALTLPKSATEAAVSFWFRKAKDLETLISIHYADFRQNIQFKRFASRIKHFLRVHDYHSEWAVMSRNGRGRVTFCSPDVASATKAASSVIERIKTLPPIGPTIDGDIPMGSPVPYNNENGWGRSTWSNSPACPSSRADNYSKHGTDDDRAQQAETNASKVDPWDDSPEGDWDKPPNLEGLTARKGTLKDMQKIAEKISERILPRVPFEGQQFGAKFCAFCSGTPCHPPHECPARSVKAHRPSFPFVGGPDEQVDSILAKIDAMTLSAAPYGPIRSGATTSEASRALEVEDSAHAYVALNWRQLTFDGPETLPSLVASCDALFSHLKVNT